MNKANRLINEKSPYLLQHAYNPVDWYPWGEEAFAKAKAEDKPVFLSIGYATCHWCHVMEHESFEDVHVAKLMNDTFVSIKVDREERPDIDKAYMAACNVMSGRGGWPLTVLLTPDKIPFFAGTYIPKESRMGYPGMLELPPTVQQAWDDEATRTSLLGKSDLIVEKVRALCAEDSSATPIDLGDALFRAGLGYMVQNFDEEYGGFGKAPKFPTPHTLLFLLAYNDRTANAQALDMVEKTLVAMRHGGMFDHVGFGFHRYSTDKKWLLPHFEKMLYDQALLAMAYADAFAATKNTEFQDVAEEILTYVLRDMTSPEGGFYTAEDADSEGEEGKFYVFSQEEICTLLGEDANDAETFFGVEAGGNFLDEATKKKTGDNILHQNQALPAYAQNKNISIDEAKLWLNRIRRTLFQAREKRIRPLLDDKIITDWNGLMIAALAKCGNIFDKSTYVDAAAKGAEFIMNSLNTNKDGIHLLHRYREGEAGLPAFLDDYAFFCWGLIELFEATNDQKWLDLALAVLEKQCVLFEDNGTFFYTDKATASELFVRPKEVYDAAIPSGNSVSALNLMRLAKLGNKPEYNDKANKLLHAFSGTAAAQPGGYAFFLRAALWQHR